MTTSSRIREHLQTNVVGYIALFCFAMAGTASALPGKQVVESNDIKKNAVKGKHVKETTLDFGVVQKRISGECGFGEAIQVVEEGGAVQCGDVGGATPTGPAGNGLAGTYPNPSIAPDAVGATQLQTNAVVGGGGGDIMDNTIVSQDVNDSGGGTLVGADVNESSLDFVGRSTFDPQCNDQDGDGEDCATQALTLTRTARVLLIGAANGSVFNVDDGDTGSDNTSFARGQCQFRIDGVDLGDIQDVTMFNTGQDAGMSSSYVTGVLSAGLHTFVWRCTEVDGDFDFAESSISAVALSAL